MNKKLIKDFDTSSFVQSGGMIGGGGGGGGTEFYIITTPETYNPDKQDGLMHVVFNKDGVNAGTVKYYLDGILQDTYDSSTAAGQYNELVDPTTSIQFVSAAGTWAETAYSGNYSNVNGSGLISDFHGAGMSPDGYYVVRVGDRRMMYYSLTTPYDLTTEGGYDAYDTQSFGSTYVYSCRYGNSGANIFVGTNNNNVWRLTTDNGAYKWTSNRCGTSGQIQQYDVTNGGALGSGQIYGLELSSDGTKMFTTLSSNNNNIYQHTLSTPWDLTTASYDNKSYNTTMNASDMRSFAMSNDGVWLYTTTGAAGSSLLYRHEMSTPYDITTATIDSTSIDISTLFSYTSLKLNSAMFVMDNNTKVAIQNQGGTTEIQYVADLQTIFNGNFEIATS